MFGNISITGESVPWILFFMVVVAAMLNGRQITIKIGKFMLWLREKCQLSSRDVSED